MNKIIILICTLICIIIICIGCGGKKEELNSGNSSSNKIPITIEDETPEEKQETPSIAKKLKSNEEIVEDVINGLYGNGKSRIKKLKKEGYNASLIQSLVDKKLSTSIIYQEEIPEEEIIIEEEYYALSENNEALNAYNGVVYYDGHKETYYSQNVLPGGGLDIPGRHVAEDGTIRDENGYICVAANESYLPYGSIVETSLGTGKVYDSGCDYGTIDIYTNW